MNIHKKPRYGGKFLELQMQDAQDGLEEAACYFSYQPVAQSIEILSIEPANHEKPARPPFLPQRNQTICTTPEKQPCKRHIGTVQYLRNKTHQQSA